MNRIILTCAACLIMASAFNVRAYAQKVQPPSPGTLPVKPPSTGTLTVLHTFNMNTDGDQLRGSLVSHPLTGRLYGLASEGGPHGNYTNGPCDSDWKSAIHWSQCPGTLFSMNADGTDFRVEHAFSQSTLIVPPSPTEVRSEEGSNSDGYHPWGSLAVTSDGVLHGVTLSGGAKAGGVLFSFDPSIGPSSFNVDHSFCPTVGPQAAGCYDGSAPMGSLAVLSDGHRVIGTAKAGGNTHDDGTVWVWDSSSRTFGSVSLTSATTGRTPLGGFADSSLYGGGAFGMTGRGLTSYCNQDQGCGAPFYFDPNAMTVTPYPAFPNSMPSPYSQYAALQTPYVLPGNHILFPREGAGFYGTGALYELDDSHGTWLLSDRFDFHCISSTPPPSPRFSNLTGAFPNGQLASLPSAPHVLYGTSVYGGGSGRGAIYSYDTIAHTEQLSYSFPTGSGQPGYPAGGLMYYGGAFYGTTYVPSVVFKFVP
jgi:uncharacterized repeat protein (TIGR03803 family)